MSEFLFARLPERMQIDTEALCAFETHLDPQRPTENRLPCRILGYGEISTVFEIQVEGFSGIALKRMSIFKNEEELQAYRQLYDRYIELLEDEVGLALPPNGYVACASKNGAPVFYILQQMVRPEAFGDQALAGLTEERGRALLESIMKQLQLVWAFNRRGTGDEIAVDGQISNWAQARYPPGPLAGFESVPEDAAPSRGRGLGRAGGDPAHSDKDRWLYLDTSTPLLRIDGVEQLDTELFLRAAPSFLRWILRLFFVDEVVERYYDPRLLLIDLGANFYKDELANWIPSFLTLANDELGRMQDGDSHEPITEKELRAYFREDQFIWKLYMGMRRFDQFLHVNLLRREYPYILPPRKN